MGKLLAKRVCACGCGERYRPKNAWHKYATPNCKNRTAQRRLRERHKETIQRLIELETKAEAANGA